MSTTAALLVCKQEIVSLSVAVAAAAAAAVAAAAAAAVALTNHSQHIVVTRLKKTTYTLALRRLELVALAPLNDLQGRMENSE